MDKQQLRDMERLDTNVDMMLTNHTLHTEEEDKVLLAIQDLIREITDPV